MPSSFTRSWTPPKRPTRSPNQGDPTTPGLAPRPHPFGAAAGLAKTAPSHQQPYPPGSSGWQLFGPGSIAPIVFERGGCAGRHRSDERVGLGLRQIGELFEQGGGHLFALLFFPRPNLSSPIRAL